MPFREGTSRLSAVVAFRQPNASRVLAQLASRVIPQFGGRESLNGTWIFGSATGAVLAAYELYRLSSEDVFATVFTGETQTSGPLRGILSERAINACQTVRRSGVYICAATQRIVEDLPADLWIFDGGLIAIESGGVEHLFELRRGAEEPTPIATKGTGIPNPRNSFVGRHEEIERIGNLLSECFLVSIVGLPGIGKSAVAAAVAHSVEVEYDDGVFWIDASDCTAERELLDKLQRATWPGRLRRAEPLSVLANRLKNRSALIVLDNCELVTDGVCEIANKLLSNTSHLSILVTSPVALKISKEHVYVLPRLSLPAPGNEVQTLRLFDSDALALFAERARAAQGEFTLTVDNVEMVADICRRLDGNPLAIEIAAAKLSGASLKTLLKQMPKAFGFKNEAPSRPHHKSLKLAYAYAFEITPEAQRRLLLELSLFSGLFSFEIADSIWGDESTFALSDDLDQLVRRSLLSFNPQLGKYWVAPLLKDYLHELFAADPEFSSLSTRFCEHMFEIGLEANRLFNAKEEAAALGLLDEHYTDIEVACRTAFHVPELHGKVRDLLPVLPHYWGRRNSLPKVDTLMLEAMDSIAMEPEQLANYLTLIGGIRVAAHDYPGAEQCCQRVIAMADQLVENSLGLYRAYGNIGYVCHRQSRWPEAIEYYTKTIEMAEARRESIRLVNVLLNAADVRVRWVRSIGPPPNVDEHLTAAAVLADQAEPLIPRDDAFWLGSLLSLRGDIALAAGDLVAAKYSFVRAALLCEEFGMPFESTQALDRLAEIGIGRKRYSEAAKLLGLSVSLRVTHERPRDAVEEAQADRMMSELAKAIGKSRLQEYLKFGASCAIGDLCVLTDVTY